MRVCVAEAHLLGESELGRAGDGVGDHVGVLSRQERLGGQAAAGSRSCHWHSSELRELTVHSGGTGSTVSFSVTCAPAANPPRGFPGLRSSVDDTGGLEDGGLAAIGVGGPVDHPPFVEHNGGLGARGPVVDHAADRVGRRCVHREAVDDVGGREPRWLGWCPVSWVQVALLLPTCCSVYPGCTVSVNVTFPPPVPPANVSGKLAAPVPGAVVLLVGASMVTPEAGLEPVERPILRLALRPWLSRRERMTALIPVLTTEMQPLPLPKARLNRTGICGGSVSWFLPR